MKTLYMAIALILASATLVGCGNKGPLLTPIEAAEAEKNKKKY